MAKVEISINGRLYSVACDEGQQGRVRALATALDARVRLLTDQAGPGPVNEPHLLVLAGLMLADELDEAKAEATRTGNGAHSDVLTDSDDEDLLVAAVDHLAERIETIAARLDRS
jgi:cell division protein ZapA